MTSEPRVSSGIPVAVECFDERDEYRPRWTMVSAHSTMTAADVRRSAESAQQGRLRRANRRSSLNPHMFPTSAAKTALVRSGLVSIQAPSFDAECVEMSRFVGGSRLPRPPLRIGGRGACCACIPWFACAQNSLAASAARSLRAVTKVWPTPTWSDDHHLHMQLLA